MKIEDAILLTENVLKRFKYCSHNLDQEEIEAISIILEYAKNKKNTNDIPRWKNSTIF